MDRTKSTKATIAPSFWLMAAWGPGLLAMLADTDAGNVVTAAQSGAQWGYRLLPLRMATRRTFGGRQNARGRHR